MATVRIVDIRMRSGRLVYRLQVRAADGTSLVNVAYKTADDAVMAAKQFTSHPVTVSYWCDEVPADRYGRACGFVR